MNFELYKSENACHFHNPCRPFSVHVPCLENQVFEVVDLGTKTSKKALLLYKGCRRNISIGIPLNLSIPTEMGYIQPLVENKNSAKL